MATDRLLDEYISHISVRAIDEPLKDAIVRHLDNTLFPWIALCDEQRKRHSKSPLKTAYPRDRLNPPTVELLKSKALSKMGQVKAKQLCESIIEGTAELSTTDQDFLTVIFFFPFHES